MCTWCSIRTNGCSIDVGFQETIDEIVDLIRQLDFPLSNCKTVIATHADVDHIQGLAKIKQILKAPVSGHPKAAKPLAEGIDSKRLPKSNRKIFTWKCRR